MAEKYDGVDITWLKYDKDAIKREVSMTDLVERYGHPLLTAKGTPYNGIGDPLISCISHNDKHPSMGVVEHGRDGCGYCNCFSCGASFDCISFVQNQESCSFKEACFILCEMYDIPIERVTNIHEVKRKYHIDEEYTEPYEEFPLSSDDCSLIGIALPQYCRNSNDSIIAMWKENKEQLENNLADLFETAKEEIYGEIGNAKEKFFVIRNMRTTSEWKEAEKVQAAVVKNADEFSVKEIQDGDITKIEDSTMTLTDKQMLLLSDYRALQKIACEIYGLEQQIGKLNVAESKLTRAQGFGRLSRGGQAQSSSLIANQQNLENDDIEKD